MAAVDHGSDYLLLSIKGHLEQKGMKRRRADQSALSDGYLYEKYPESLKDLTGPSQQPRLNN